MFKKSLLVLSLLALTGCTVAIDETKRIDKYVVNKCEKDGGDYLEHHIDIIRDFYTCYTDTKVIEVYGTRDIFKEAGNVNYKNTTFKINRESDEK